MSNDTEFNRSLDAQEEELARSHKAARRRNMLIWILAVLSIAFGIGCLFFAMDNARLAGAAAVYGAAQQQEKQSLAEEFDKACQAADFQQTDAGTNICKKAEQVAAEPGAPVAGPAGAPGVPGPRGEQGFPGVMGPPGSPGKDGAPGKDGSQGIAGLLGLTGSQGQPGPPGPVGATGATGNPGADSTVPGPPGPAGEPGSPGVDGQDGAMGPQGPAGQDGRGIKTAYCNDNGRWIITYTDGEVQDGGQCRTTPSGVLP